MKKALLTGSLLLAFAGLDLAPPHPPVAASTPTVVAQQPTNPAQPKLELLNPGAEPRQTLRFKPAANARQTAILTVKLNTQTSTGGAPLPSFKLPTSVLTMETVVTKVDPNGDIHYQFRYTKAEVVPDTGVPKPVLDAVRAQNQKLVGLSGSFVMDDRGQTKSGSFNLPPNLDPQTRQFLEQMSQSATQFTYPFPEVAVGRGASWRVSSPISSGGITLTQTATYQLANLDGGVATLDVSLQQKANPQSLDTTGAPPGTKLMLNSLNSTGNGRITQQLNQIVPVRSSINVQTNTELTTSGPGLPGETKINSRANMEMMLESK